MSIDEMSNSQKGNAGLGMAIAYYTSKGNCVSLPLNDTQKYDLIVDINGVLKRVQVKTTNFKNRSGRFYKVHLRTTGGNSSRNTAEDFDHSACDTLFVLTGNQEMYEIPTNGFTNTNELVLTSDRDKYKVKL